MADQVYKTGECLFPVAELAAVALSRDDNHAILSETTAR
jgi:hypothetical protein